jgi:Holliday junction resolvase RusA-like endonuclease
MKKHEFRIERKPKAKGRPRATKSGHVYTDKSTRDYESFVKEAYQSSGGERFEGPVQVKINVYSNYADVTIESIDNESKLRGDLDNYIKSILDGLNGVAYTDDKQVHKIEGKKL